MTFEMTSLCDLDLYSISHLPILHQRINLARNMLLNHYQLLLNSIPDSPVHLHNIDMYCSNIQINDNVIVQVKEQQTIISTMPVGKASGYDQMINEHLVC